MTDQELQQLAREYAEQYPPFSDPEISKVDRDSMIDTMTDYAEEILRWLTKTHCIVSREKVKALEVSIHANIMYAHDEDDWQDASHYILDVMPRIFAAVFGSELFEERSEE